MDPLLPINGTSPSLVVFKFGGTSVGEISRFRNVVRVVAEAAQAMRVVVVNSALARVTRRLDAAFDAVAEAGGRPKDDVVDLLIERLRTRHRLQATEVLTPAAQMQYASVVEKRLARLRETFAQIREGSPVPAARDAVLAAGEQLAVPMVALALQDAGIDACLGEAASLLRTDATFGQANVDHAVTRAALREWYDALPPTAVPVLAGFIGGTPEGDITTLGFEGSDYSAALFASILNADVLIRYTDVDGIYTKDPHVHEDAALIEQMAIEEALAQTEAGTLGMHPKTLRPLAEAGIPLRIRSISKPEAPGTLIAPAVRLATVRSS